MRILALDVGERRIGLAVSDELGLAAHGLPTLERTALSEDLRRLEKIITDRQAEKVVVGLPRNMNGTLGPQAAIVLEFIERLQKRIPRIPIIPWDERLSTKAAERVLLEADLSRAKRKKKSDLVAAVIILQGYLDSRAISVEGGVTDPSP
jgi:putative Holliday junction resolvase